jgi:hypothetical protein
LPSFASVGKGWNDGRRRGQRLDELISATEIACFAYCPDEERNPTRLERPQTEWDILQGLLMEYQRGDVPVARAYLNRQAEGRQQLILDLLHVWTEEMPDEKVRKEAHTLLFGLKSTSDR